MTDLLRTAKLGDHWNEGLPWAGAVLPAQFYSERKGPAADDPLHRLMRAIMADAIRCFQTGFDARQPTKQHLFAEVWSWIFDEGDGVFSYRALCDVLELDPGAIRKGLVAWCEERLQENELRQKRSMEPASKRILDKGRKIALRRSRFT